MQGIINESLLYPHLKELFLSNHMNSQLIAYFRQLHPISDNDSQLITAAFERKTFKEGDYLFKGNNKVCHQLFFINNGVVRIASVNDKGNDVVHYFYRENSYCTILQSFNEEIPTDTSIQACCDVVALVIAKPQLELLYQQLPYLKGIIHRINQEQLLQKVHTRNAYLGEDAESRYRIFITQQADIAQRVSQKDIAAFLGITQQSLSRIRKNIR